MTFKILKILKCFFQKFTTLRCQNYVKNVTLIPEMNLILVHSGHTETNRYDFGIFLKTKVISWPINLFYNPILTHHKLFSFLKNMIFILKQYLDFSKTDYKDAYLPVFRINFEKI